MSRRSNGKGTPYKPLEEKAALSDDDRQQAIYERVQAPKARNLKRVFACEQFSPSAGERCQVDGGEAPHPDATRVGGQVSAVLQSGVKCLVVVLFENEAGCVPPAHQCERGAVAGRHPCTWRACWI